MKKLLLLLFLIPTIVMSQTVFKVFSNKGDISLLDNDIVRPLKTGESLSEKQSLQIAAGGYVCLYHIQTGQPIEIKTEGLYKLSEIKPVKNASVVSKYTEFILSSNSPDERRNRISATGAVHRGVTNKKLIVFLPNAKNNKLIGDEVFIRWHYENHIPFQTKYVVKIQNAMEDDLKKFTTNDTTITLQLNKLNLYDDNLFLVVIEVDGIVSDHRAIVIADKMQKEKILNEVKEQEKNPFDSKLFQTLVISGIYEQNGYLLDAMNVYLKARTDAELQPMIDNLYQQYLIRNSLR